MSRVTLIKYENNDGVSKVIGVHHSMANAQEVVLKKINRAYKFNDELQYARETAGGKITFYLVNWGTDQPLSTRLAKLHYCERYMLVPYEVKA